MVLSIPFVCLTHACTAAGLLYIPENASLEEKCKRLELAAECVTSRLYVALTGRKELSIGGALQHIGTVYSCATHACKNTDTRVLVPSVHTLEPTMCLAPELDILISFNSQEASRLDELNGARTSAGLGLVTGTVLEDPGISCAPQTGVSAVDLTTDLTEYDTSVLGGSFDRLHAGHKLLLSAAALHARHRVIIGVMADELLVEKKAGMLIEPFGIRCSQVSLFLNAVVNSTQYGREMPCKVETVKLNDPVGPAGTKADIDCIVVSEETERGAHFCNDRRSDNNLKPLDICTVKLVGSTDLGLGSTVTESDKQSSSQLRIQSLGRLRGSHREWMRQTDPLASPYVIGLTGGIGTGKSTVLQALRQAGGDAVDILDADLLAHDAYAPGTSCFNDVVAAFGPGVVGEDGRIDRPALGALVFADDSSGPRMRRQLEGIVWPYVSQLIRDRQQQSKLRGVRVLVMEAALLLEAGWDRLVDEVWCVCVSPRTQVERVMDRNGLAEDEARARVAAQMSTHERIARSHVVLCSQWEKESTAAQAKLALAQVLERRADPSCVNPKSDSPPLLERWSQLVRSIAVDGDEREVDALTRTWWRRLYDLYSQPHRYYHTLDHLQNLFACQSRLLQLNALQCPDSFSLAAFFHNANYNPAGRDNAERSEKLFHDFCADLNHTALTVPLDLTRVSETILQTSDHSDNTTLDVMSDTAAFLDSMLGVMGAAPQQYARYCEGLRLEHAHLDEEKYREDRGERLRQFAGKAVFNTPHFQHLEDCARCNIEAEIARHQARAPW